MYTPWKRKKNEQFKFAVKITESILIRSRRLLEDSLHRRWSSVFHMMIRDPIERTFIKNDGFFFSRQALLACTLSVCETGFWPHIFT